MPQTFLSEFGALFGGVVASAFALARMSMSQQKSLVERFMNFMESALTRQEQTLERFAESIDRLNQNLESVEKSPLKRRVQMNNLGKVLEEENSHKEAK